MTIERNNHPDMSSERLGMRILLFSGLILTILALATQPRAAYAQSPDDDTGMHLVRSWNTDSGLPGNSVRAILRTGEGYIWIGTESGLARFDGVSFRVFTPGTVPLFSEGSILCLYEDIRGILWAGTDGGGIYAFHNGGWSRIGEEDGLLDSHIRAITGDWNGTIWAATEFGLHRFEEESIEIFGLEHGFTANILTALSIDGFGRLWTGTMWGGVALFDGGLVLIYDYEWGLANLSVLSLHAGSDGTVWIGTMEGLFAMSSIDREISYMEGTSRYPVTALAETPQRKLLVGTMVEGLKIRDGSGFIDLLPGDEFGNCHVRSVLPDDSGNIWMGTESRGLIMLRERDVGAISCISGAMGESIYGVLETEDGELWAGTEDRGLCRIEGGMVKDVLDGSDGLAGEMVRTISADRNGRIWVGTMDGGLSIISDSGITGFGTGEGLPSNNITALLHGGDGTAWIGTDRGLVRASAEHEGEFIQTGVLAGQAIRTLYESGEGTVYAGTRSGLWKSEGSTFVRTGAGSADSDVLSVCICRDGGVWAGTNGAGLRYISEEEPCGFTSSDGLPGNFIYSITEIDTGMLWISCESGVFAVCRDSLLAYAAGETKILTPTVYDDVEGMPSRSCNGFCTPAVMVSRNGRLYYPTKGGIAFFDTALQFGEAKPPVVVIESVLADGEEFRPGATLELGGETGRVEILFTAFDWRAPEKCRFLYKLEGYDEDHIPLHPGINRRAVYDDLPPGSYRFTVRAAGNGGIWSESPATVNFTIARGAPGGGIIALYVAAAAFLITAVAALIAIRKRPEDKKPKYSTSTISSERMDEAMEGLRTLIEEDNVYLDPDLTLKKLAKKLGIHYNHLSRMINEQFGMSFNHYINRFRIEEAMRQLSDRDLAEKNILDIMYDSGFYSKSTFNTAFRKIAGCSPSEYRTRHLN